MAHAHCPYHAREAVAGLPSWRFVLWGQARQGGWVHVKPSRINLLVPTALQKVGGQTWMTGLDRAKTWLVAAALQSPTLPIKGGIHLHLGGYIGGAHYSTWLVRLRRIDGAEGNDVLGSRTYPKLLR